MAEITWSEAPQSVIHTAEVIIRQYHPHLKDAHIAFVMRSEGQKRGQRMIIGNTCKVPDKMQPFLEYDFLVWLSELDYKDMSDATREALIDHELCHMKKNFDDDTWTLREHDVQEFAVVISRRGLWTEDLRRVDAAINMYQQETFPELMSNALVEMGATRKGNVVTITGEQLDKMTKATK
jgi:hypothetical protein